MGLDVAARFPADGNRGERALIRVAAGDHVGITAGRQLLVGDVVFGSAGAERRERSADTFGVIGCRVRLGTPAQLVFGTQEPCFGGRHPHNVVVVGAVYARKVFRIGIGRSRRDAGAYAVVLTLGRRHEVLAAARVLIAVHVGFDRGADARVVEIVLDHVKRVFPRTGGGFVQLREVGGAGHQADRIADGGRSLLLGQRRVGIDHAHGQTQAQRIGEFDPAAHVARKDVVVSLQQFGAGLCLVKRGQCRDGGVQLLEEAFVNRLLRIVGLVDVPAADVEVGDGAVGIGYAVHRGDLHDVGEGDHFGEFAALGIELVPCADDAGVGVVEHGVVPVLARDVVEVVAREAGVDDSGVAGEDVAREVLDDLIVGAAVLLVADQLEGGDDVLGHLREGRTR